jgi:hypothetical protein
LTVLYRFDQFDGYSDLVHGWLPISNRVMLTVG